MARKPAVVSKHAESRFSLIGTAEEADREAFGRDVTLGLTASPKHLSCRYLYDAEGSRLFERICELPEYYLTRAEGEILTAHAGEIAGRLPAGTAVVELGSGSAVKTRLLLSAFLARQTRLLYVPIDVSRSALEESSHALVADYPRLSVRAIAAEYNEGLRLLAEPPAVGSPRLILWLGSNIGNLTPAAAGQFLAGLRARMEAGDRLLVGIDLRKDPRVLRLAYDDPRGVTARFSRNILARINRELGGQFDVDGFQHRAVYHEDSGWVEISLVARWAQRVSIRALGLSVDFAKNEAIHTEDSFKYSLAEIDRLAEGAGLRVDARWLDGEGRFSENLLAPI